LDVGQRWRVLWGDLDRFLERFLKDSFAVSVFAFFELIEVVRLVWWTGGLGQFLKDSFGVSVF
jgi:hypothetical protein